MNRLLVATRSAPKLREIQAIVAGSGVIQALDLTALGIPRSSAEEELERFDTFRDNALAKARYFRRFSTLPVLADDSGLCVDALDGAPGVRSKRFAGMAGDPAEVDAANNRYLLERLSGIPLSSRSAHYVCVLALLLPNGAEHLFEGRCHGLILDAPRGNGGFGYDPLFFVPSEGLTFAEMPSERKNLLSHRRRALEQLARHLQGRAETGSSVDRSPAIG